MMESPVPNAVPTASSGHYSRHYAAAAGASGTLPSSLKRPPAAKSQRFARHQNGGSGIYSSREYLFYPQVKCQKPGRKQKISLKLWRTFDLVPTA